MKIDEHFKEIITGKVCPYCGSQSVLVDSAVIYGRSYGMIYLCSDCDAYVGCHQGTTRAKGRLADKELREAKKKAHYAFDALWKKGLMTRKDAYHFLSETLDIPEEYTHIGMFDVETCERVIEACRPFNS